MGGDHDGHDDHDDYDGHADHDGYANHDGHADHDCHDGHADHDGHDGKDNRIKKVTPVTRWCLEGKKHQPNAFHLFSLKENEA